MLTDAVIKEAIEQIGDDFSDRVFKKVSTVLKDKLSEKESDKLSKEDVISISKYLMAGGERSYETWRHRHCFNRLIQVLRNKKAIVSPYINIPQQISRHLIAEIEKETLEDARLIKVLQDDLLSLRAGPYKDAEEEENDYVCSYVASAVIFAKVLFPKCHEELLSIKLSNVSFAPAFINIHYRNVGDTFYRYFLPPPASLYLYRCILFYDKNHNKLGINKLQSPDDSIFRTEKPLQRFREIFKKWTVTRLRANGIVDAKGFSPETFRNAALKASILNFESTVCPPFVLALQSRYRIGHIELNSYSYNRIYLQFFLDLKKHKTGFIKDARKRKTTKSPEAFRELTSTIKKITKIRRRLMVNEPCRLEDKRAAAEEIMTLLNSIKTKLSSEDYENLRLYTEWLCDLILYSKRRLKISSINTYASEVPNLLYELQGEGVMYELSSEHLTLVIAETMSKYESRGIRKALKCFTEFLSSHLGDRFVRPDWERSPELRKKDIHFQKPLIDFRYISLVLKNCNDCITGNIAIRKKINLKTLNKAEHKAIILGHMVSLGFYAGLRVSEFVNLKVHNVIYDDGLVLCIRTSKTRNGYRNIPLSLLLPERYLKDFEKYFNSRRAASDSDDPLFPRQNGGKWDRSYISKEASSLFAYIGLHMRFHDLRHSFANWFMLRWFVTFHKDKVPDKLPFLENELFHEPYTSKLKKLMLGMNSQNTGQESFSSVLAVLARLIGHGGPIVTMNEYLHTGDIIFYLLLKEAEGKRVMITSQQAESFLQRTYPALPHKFKGRSKKDLSTKELEEGQVSPFYENLKKRLNKVEAVAEGLRSSRNMKASLKQPRTNNPRWREIVVDL